MKLIRSALTYDSDIVINALKTAREMLKYAKGDCRNVAAMDYLDDCIKGIDTWIKNAKPRNNEPVIEG